MDELAKEKRIQEEIDRLTVFYEDIDETEKAVVTPLVKNAAFMKITLEDLQKQINEEGPVDTYQNGEGQFGKKQSAALQSYNSLIKVYTNVTKQLFSKLPYSHKLTVTGWMMAERERIEHILKQQYREKYGPLDDENEEDIDTE